jgi:hypothetical protein
VVIAKTRRWVLQLADQLIAYEEGQITKDEEIKLFQHLIETGTCWQLGGIIIAWVRPLSKQG